MAADVIDLINAVYGHNQKKPEKKPTKRGRKPGGPRKLDALDVQIIREKAARGVPQASLARFFDVSPSLVSKIVSGRTWAHVVPDDTRESDIGQWRMVS